MCFYVMDRLVAWFHWNDRRSLIHALRVAEAHPINLNKIKKWAKNESAAEKFEQFLLELKKTKEKLVVFKAVGQVTQSIPTNPIIFTTSTHFPFMNTAFTLIPCQGS